MKKQVYKVGDRVKIIHCESGESFLKRHNGQIGVIKHIWIEGYRKGWVSLLLPNNECCIASKVSPLKPKKSIKKMYKYKTFCENCDKKKEIDIPFGVRARDYLPEILQVCKFCGC